MLPFEKTENESRPNVLGTTIDLPAKFSPFTDCSIHAQGGLGEVLKATDPVLHRTIAIKRLHDRHADTANFQQRFLAEAEITARLEHPGVVPVYGLFYDERQRPCYIMRFIEGQTLSDAVKDYYSGHPDPVRFRRLLQTVIQVCRTIAYAHSRGVIHRDLKPSNIMIGKFGETLVVDWGLAKIVGRPDELRKISLERTLEPVSGNSSETAIGSALGTPAYMSPEQAGGRWDVVTQPSDIYSLGAVLYTVLTGKVPLEKGNWPEIQQRIQQGDIPSPRQVKGDIPQPLEAICHKAMAVKPPDRYSNAEALASDLEHWLADEPVTAFRDSTVTRIRRWMRNHRSLVTSFVVLLFAILLASGIGLYLLGAKNEQIAAERTAAQQAAAEAEAVNAFLTDDLLGQADPDRNAQKITVEELLNKAAARIEGNVKFVDKPSIEATLQYVIAKTFFKMGKFRDAEQHFRRAMVLRQGHFGPDDVRTLAAQEAFADFLNRGLEKYGESEPLARKTWETRSRILGPEHRDTLDSLDTYATALRGSGKIEEAIERFRTCLETRRKLLGDQHLDTLVSVNNLSLPLADRGQYQEAIDLGREFLKVSEKLNLETEHASFVITHAVLLYQNGEVKEAADLLESLLEKMIPKFGDDSTHVDRVRGPLIRIWTDQGKIDKAIEMGRKVIGYRRHHYPDHHTLLNIVLADFGRALIVAGKYEEGKAILSEFLKNTEKAPLRTKYMMAIAEVWYGVALTHLKDYRNAENYLLSAVEKLRNSLSTPKRFRGLPAEQLIQLYGAWGKPSEVKKWKENLAAISQVNSESNK